MNPDSIKLNINKILRKLGYRLIKFDESEYYYREILVDFVKSQSDKFKGDILEIGALGWNVKNLITNPDSRYTSLDTRSAPNVDIVGNVMSLSKDIGNKKFDVIICFETLEHVPNPHNAIFEIYSSLKEGGTLLASTPFFYETHCEEYGDYWRITRQGWKELLKDFKKSSVKSVGIHDLKPHHYIIIAQK